MTGKDFLPEKDLLEKTAALEIFEYSSLGKELKKQTSVAEKQYQKLENSYEADKIIKRKKPTLENYSKLDLIYDANHSFFKYYRDRKKIYDLSKHSFLNEFFDDLDKLKNLNPEKGSIKDKNINVHDKASELYNNFLGIFYHKYYELSDDKRKK